VRASAVVIELDRDTLERIDLETKKALCARIGAEFSSAGYTLPVAIQPYRVGSAFLHTGAE
jgi:hypothetical protein